jgi:hypothetical protein
MGIRAAAGGSVFVLGMMAVWGLGVMLHLWTILIAFMSSGFIAAALTLIFPFVSEAYWFIKLWWNFGFWQLYTVAVMLYFGLWIVALAGGALASTEA